MSTALIRVIHGWQESFFLSPKDRYGSQLRTGRNKPSFFAASQLSFVGEGPSCIFIGPIETATQDMLEALYHQARDSYYSGKPLIIDDMFDKVELKLRLYGSKLVVKYPRCSLRWQSTYADAEEDPSQVLALASIWTLLLTFGGFFLLFPTIYSLGLVHKDLLNSSFSSNTLSSPMDGLTMTNKMLFIGLGCSIGYPIASSSLRALQGLWRNDLLALKGFCPNCGEEVFAFVKAEKSNQSHHLHCTKTECHVCKCGLEFRTKIEQTSVDSNRKRLVYGRIYLVRRRSSLR
ncbi:PGR5-like protein [Zostera marina]|uniref:PGR5-like protein n=1 Tax=Zostera marina TaxID=29655 RepID=A0A0K9P1B4_ZOSMR|nr:PGR5-like protein [Zostera marina]